MNTKKPKRHQLKPGHYWACLDHRGRQIAGDTVRRKVAAVARGTSFRIVQLPK